MYVYIFLTQDHCFMPKIKHKFTSVGPKSTKYIRGILLHFSDMYSGIAKVLKSVISV